MKKSRKIGICIYKTVRLAFANNNFQWQSCSCIFREQLWIIFEIIHFTMFQYNPSTGRNVLCLKQLYLRNGCIDMHCVNSVGKVITRSKSRRIFCALRARSATSGRLSNCDNAVQISADFNAAIRITSCLRRLNKWISMTVAVVCDGDHCWLPYYFWLGLAQARDSAGNIIMLIWHMTSDLVNCLCPRAASWCIAPDIWRRTAQLSDYISKRTVVIYLLSVARCPRDQ